MCSLHSPASIRSCCSLRRGLVGLAESLQFPFQGTRLQSIFVHSSGYIFFNESAAADGGSCTDAAAFFSAGRIAAFCTGTDSPSTPQVAACPDSFITTANKLSSGHVSANREADALQVACRCKLCQIASNLQSDKSLMRLLLLLPVADSCCPAVQIRVLQQNDTVTVEWVITWQPCSSPPPLGEQLHQHLASVLRHNLVSLLAAHAGHTCTPCVCMLEAACRKQASKLHSACLLTFTVQVCGC